MSTLMLAYRAGIACSYGPPTPTTICQGRTPTMRRLLDRAPTVWYELHLPSAIIGNSATIIPDRRIDSDIRSCELRDEFMR